VVNIGHKLSPEKLAFSRDISRDLGFFGVCCLGILENLAGYNRIKSSLPPFLSRHALEASLAGKGGWLGRQKLMDELNAHVAGMSSPPKSIVSGQKGAVTVANKTSSDKAVLKMVVSLPLRINVKVMGQRLSP